MEQPNLRPKNDDVSAKQPSDVHRSSLHRSFEETDGEALVHLLCLLAKKMSSRGSADSIGVAARVLGNGMKQVYSLDRKKCVENLPIIVNALTDVLTSGHEEALVAVANTYKNLIRTCVDQSLVEDEASQIGRNSGSTVIHQLCSNIEKLLDDKCRAIWDLSFQIVTAMFEKLGKHSFYYLKGALKNLAGIQKSLDEKFTYRKQLHECVGAALVAMGPERFLSVLPLNLDVHDLSGANLWLFQILQQYTIGAELKFYIDFILPMIEEMKHKSKQLYHEGDAHLAQIMDNIVHSLWYILPSFCNYPVDTAESFKRLEKALCIAIQEDSDVIVCGIICSSLQILIRQNKKSLEGAHKIKVSSAQKQTTDVAIANLGVLRTCSELRSVLYRAYLSSYTDTRWVSQALFFKMVFPRLWSFTTIIGLRKLGYVMLGADSRLCNAHGEVKRDNFLKIRKILTGLYMAGSGCAGTLIRLKRAVRAEYAGGAPEHVSTVVNFIKNLLSSPAESESGTCRIILAGRARNPQLELVEIKKYENGHIDVTDDEAFFKGGSGKRFVIDPTDEELERQNIAQDMIYMNDQLSRAITDPRTGGKFLILCITEHGQVFRLIMKPGPNGYEREDTRSSSIMADTDYLGPGGFGGD